MKGGFYIVKQDGAVEERPIADDDPHGGERRDRVIFERTNTTSGGLLPFEEDLLRRVGLL